MRSIFLLIVTILSGINCKAASSNKNDPRIVIVGGGLAGVTALAELLENGYGNVVLLEAQRRIGGRVKTIPFGANVFDIGAEWVHGEKYNVIFEMVSKYGLLDRTPYEWVGVGGKFLY
jgi:spermine oxidase